MIIKVKTLAFCENFMSTETFTKYLTCMCFSPPGAGNQRRKFACDYKMYQKPYSHLCQLYLRNLNEVQLN